MTPPEHPSRLLVVDDDLASRTSLAARLEKRGYAVDGAEGASAALEKILREHYDLVLLDQRMPEMSGLDLLRLLRATHSETDLPVIMVTGADDHGTIVAALHEGANDYVIKPVTGPEIAARVQAQLSRAEQARNTEARLERDPRAEAAWEWDPASGAVHYSRAWKEFVGSSGQECTGGLNEWFDRVHSLDLLRVRREFHVFVEGAASEFRCEHRLHRGAGRHRWVVCRATAARDGEGRPVRVAGSFTDIDARKTTDPLTGLGNRQCLQDAMAAVLARPAEGDLRHHPWMVLLLDLNGFRAFNELHGEAAGDPLLVRGARRIQAAVAFSRIAEGSTLARCGSDEFAVLARCDACDAAALAEALLEAFANPMPEDDLQVSLSINIGIALSDGSGVSLDQMLASAGQALKAAQAEGPNRWHVSAPDLRERERLRQIMTRDLRHATERKQLVALYQPQICLATRRLVGFEALMRWRHPELGLLMPGDFISIAEETGLITSLGEWILGEACRQLRAWRDRFPFAPPVTIAVNISPCQLRGPSLLAHLRRALDESGIRPEMLDLELTESCMIGDPETARHTLTAIHQAGVRLTLDDFGTGFANLAHLKIVHFDALKIDRSFVARIDSEAESLAIIKTILALAQDLRMGVIAEGIEDQGQMETLASMGCQVGQGYYFARPVDASTAGEMLRQLSQQSEPSHVA